MSEKHCHFLQKYKKTSGLIFIWYKGSVINARATGFQTQKKNFEFHFGIPVAYLTLSHNNNLSLLSATWKKPTETQVLAQRIAQTTELRR